MPTKEQLENRKKLVAEVRTLRNSKLYFRHDGYAHRDEDGACTVCILGSLIAASMVPEGRYAHFFEAPIDTTSQVLGSRVFGAGWAQSAVMKLCGLSALDAYTLEAVYEKSSRMMGLHGMDDTEIDSVEDLLWGLDKVWSLKGRTDDEVAELLLQILEKSADHPEGELIWPEVTDSPSGRGGAREHS